MLDDDLTIFIMKKFEHPFLDDQTMEHEPDADAGKGDAGLNYGSNAGLMGIDLSNMGSMSVADAMPFAGDFRGASVE